MAVHATWLRLAVSIVRACNMFGPRVHNKEVPLALEHGDLRALLLR